MIKIWDWEIGTLERTIKAHDRDILDIDYGGPKNGVILASCSSDLTIKLWDPANEYKNTKTLTGHDHVVSALRFINARNGELLVSASADKTIKIWNVITGYCVSTIQGHASWVRDVCSSFDGRFLLSCSTDQTARLWDISRAQPMIRLTMIGHENVVKCCAFAPPAAHPYLASMAGLRRPAASNTAKFMATGSRDKTIKLWDIRGICIKTLYGHDNWVTSLVFHPGGKYLLSVADDKTLRCWDLSQGGRCVKVMEVHEHFISSIRWAPGIPKDPLTPPPEQSEEANKWTSRRRAAASTPDEEIRCIIATASVDMTVKIFAN